MCGSRGRAFWGEGRAGAKRQKKFNMVEEALGGQHGWSGGNSGQGALQRGGLALKAGTRSAVVVMNPEPHGRF